MIAMNALNPAPLLSAKPLRHLWGEPVRFQFKTERTCLHGCGITKTTWHQPGEYPWDEFYCDGVKIEATRTPACL